VVAKLIGIRRSASAVLSSHSRLYAPPEVHLAHLSACAETTWTRPPCRPCTSPRPSLTTCCGTLDEAISKGRKYMAKVEEARGALGGLTVRYEELTVSPETVIGQVCEFIGVRFEPAMLDYGQLEPAGSLPRR
jgi:hypothetical protein